MLVGAIGPLRPVRDADRREVLFDRRRPAHAAERFDLAGNVNRPDFLVLSDLA